MLNDINHIDLLWFRVITGRALTSVRENIQRGYLCLWAHTSCINVTRNRYSMIFSVLKTIRTQRLYIFFYKHLYIVRGEDNIHEN